MVCCDERTVFVLTTASVVLPFNTCLCTDIKDGVVDEDDQWWVEENERNRNQRIEDKAKKIKEKLKKGREKDMQLRKKHQEYEDAIAGAKQLKQASIDQRKEKKQKKIQAKIKAVEAEKARKKAKREKAKREKQLRLSQLSMKHKKKRRY